MPTVLPWTPGQTPYVTPDQLYSAAQSATMWPTGVQWNTIPGVGASSEAQFAILAMLCQQATTRAEQILNQPLRATLSTELKPGPDYYITVQRETQNARIICSRWPVMAVTNVQVSPNNTFPRQWTVLPSGNYEPEYPVQSLFNTSAAAGAGEGGQSVIIAPGFVTWQYGRKGWRVQVTYYAGWPHTCLTAPATAGSSSIAVDDCTFWAPVAGSFTGASGIGAAGVIYDGLGGGQESISCVSASATQGPGTLTLASPLNFSHGFGVMVSAMPQSAILASALLAANAALIRGATATTSQTTGGRQQLGRSLEETATKMLTALRRTE